MDLRTTYMGLDLKNPLMVSACPLSSDVDNIKRMEDAGAAGVVMFSLFEEQIKHETAALDYFMQQGTNSFGEALSYFPDIDEYHAGTQRYLDILHRASNAVDIPVMGSLNGVSNEGWIEYAKKMEEAGAAGIELNMYQLPTDMNVSGAEIEDRYIDVFSSVKNSVKIPVAIKLSAFFSSFPHMAKRLDDARADALVLFNRFYQPDIDLEKLEVSPSLHLSTPYEIRLPLRWIAILYGNLGTSLGATRGVHSGGEVIKYIMAGADAVFVASVILKNGIEFIGAILEEVTHWMEERGYHSVADMKGVMSQQSVGDPAAFERANYIKVLESFKSEYAG